VCSSDLYDQKGVVMHHGLFSDSSDHELFPKETQVVGVNLKNVWTARGWHSRDMRDYLRIPKRAKLILFTCTYDPLLEAAWNKSVHTTDFAKLGFDAWEVYELSNYGDYSSFYNLWMGKRMLQAGEESKSWFAQAPPNSIKGSAKALRPWTKWAAAVPQMTVQWQFVSVRDPGRWKAAVASLRVLLREYMPGIKALWFQGVATAAQVFNLQRAFPELDCYFLSSSPWVRAFRRKEYTAEGTYRASDRDRLDLLLHNQTNYATLVADAICASRQSAGGPNALGSKRQKEVQQSSKGARQRGCSANRNGTRRAR
jgi:hypothetical protein